jgi:hypothetical protein
MKDKINPDHYKQGEIECIDAIEAAVVNKMGIEAVCTANIIKYLWRYENKNGVEDVEKARWYTNKLITHLYDNIRKNHEPEQSDVRVPTKSPENQEGLKESTLQKHLRKSSKHFRCCNARVDGMWYRSCTSSNERCINYKIDSQ